MPALLERLNDEHRNLARFLYCFKYQLRGFEDPNQETNINLILDMLDYINTIPERYHHPAEDVMFKRMLTKDFDKKDLVQSIIDDHANLESITVNLKNDFNAIAMDIAVPMDRLKQKVEEYLDAQLEHLDIEESEIYPLAEELLDETDWQELDTQIEQIGEDPLFDQTKAEYEQMYREVVNFDIHGGILD